jgi:protein SCO1/2
LPAKLTGVIHRRSRRDTTESSSRPTREHGATRDRWLFDGNKALYDLCMKGFKLPLDDTDGTEAEPITHSTRFVLVDKDGEVRGYYSGTEEEALQRLAVDARKLL